MYTRTRQEKVACEESHESAKSSDVAVWPHKPSEISSDIEVSSSSESQEKKESLLGKIVGKVFDSISLSASAAEVEKSGQEITVCKIYPDGSREFETLCNVVGLISAGDLIFNIYPDGSTKYFKLCNRCISWIPEYADRQYYHGVGCPFREQPSHGGSYRYVPVTETLRVPQKPLPPSLPFPFPPKEPDWKSIGWGPFKGMNLENAIWAKFVPPSHSRYAHCDIWNPVMPESKNSRAKSLEIMSDAELSRLNVELKRESTPVTTTVPASKSIAKRITRVGSGSVKIVGGSLLVAGSVAAIVATAATGGAALPIIVLTAGSAGIMFGASDIHEGVGDVAASITGEGLDQKSYNPVREELFGGNEIAYAGAELVVSLGTSVAAGRAIAAGAGRLTTPAKVVEPVAKPPMISEQPNLGNKLDYIFGKATGFKHNVERSQGMASELSKIGIHDTTSGRGLLQSHLSDVFNNPGSIVGSETRTFTMKELPGSPVQSYIATTRESLLMGPGGAVKIESVWDKNTLLTVIIKGGK